MKIDNEFLTKIKELSKKYEPDVITVTQLRIKVLSAACAVIAYNSYRQQAFRLTHSNNWLKMHGYPMKRKSQK